MDNETPQTHLLTERGAAIYIAMSVAFLRADRTRGATKGRTQGPPWLRLGRAVRYDLRDLDLWLASRRVNRRAERAQAAPTVAA